MNGMRFDAVTRGIAGAASRRRVLAWLAAAAWRGAAGPVSAGCGGCPAAKPCCIGGRCRRRCGDACCANCFVEKDLSTGETFPGSEVCCGGAVGAVCRGRKRSPKDDRCCYPDETCVKGKCCGQNALGSKKCGGRCCPIASCCNGSCCPKGKVCAGTPRKCRAADRPCGSCEPDEDCVGGVCCTEVRTCANTTEGTVCCPYGEYCDTNLPGAPRCCTVNTVCNSFRAGRVRP